MTSKINSRKLELMVSSRAIVLALAVGTLLPSAAYAQTTDAQPSDSAAETSANSGEIIVTAERRNARTVDTPITLTALSSDQLATRGATGMLDLTKVVPGLKMDQYGPSVFPAIRGITTSVSGIGISSNVAVYMDGFYQATPTALNSEFPDISNVQVLKGPQGTLFGRNATGGAILVTTRDPGQYLDGQVSLGYGTYDEKIANAFVSGPLSDRLGASLSASYRQSDGYTRNVVTQTKDGTYKGFNLRGKLVFEANDWLTLKLQGEHTYINDPMSMVYRVEGPNATADFVPGAIVTRDYLKTSSDIKSVLSKKVDAVYFTAKADTGGVTITSLTGYGREKDDFVFDFDGSSLEEVNFGYSQNINTLTQELIVAGQSGDLEWSLGGFYLHQNGRMPTEEVNGFNIQSVHVDTSAYAAYVDGTYNIAPKLYITAGVRYSHERKELDYLAFDNSSGQRQKAWSSVTPRAVIRYQADRDTSVYASYSKGFAAGVYSPFSPESGPANPEKLSAFEVGFKHASPIVSLDLAGFYYKYSDMQFVLYTAGPTGVVSNLSNVGRAEVYGTEGSLRVRVSDALTVFASGAYTHSRYKQFPGAVRYAPLPGGGYDTVPVDASGNQLIRSPDFTGNAGFNVHLPVLGGTVDFGPNVYFVTKSYNDAANELPIEGHALLDLSASWTSGDELWKLAVVGKNVANRHYINYWDPSNSALLVNDGAPRTVRFTVTRRF